MFRIQVAVSNKGRETVLAAPADLAEWHDLENMPEFNSLAEAMQWAVENKLQELEKFGLKFQIACPAGSAPLSNTAEIQGVARFKILSDNDAHPDIDPEIIQHLDSEWNEHKTARAG